MPLSRSRRPSADRPGEPQSQWRNDRLLLAAMPVLAAAVILVHWPALSAQALIMDDAQYLIDNPLVKNPGWASARKFLVEVLKPSTVAGYYQPLAMNSLMLDYALGGRPDDLYPFHRTSLLLHTANVCLIALLLYQLFGRPWVAAAAALLFGLHPMTVEPIPWIGERKTLLAAFFALLSLIAYVRYAGGTRDGGRGTRGETPKRRNVETSKPGTRTWFALCITCYVLALMSKPTSTPLPLLLLLLDAWPLRRFNRRVVLEKLPFLALGAVFAVITVISQERSGRITPPGEQGPVRILLILCHNIIFYLHKLLLPAGLSPHYPVPQPLSLGQPRILAGVIGTVLLLSALLLSLRRTRALLVGWLFFFVAALPTMGVIGFTNVIASDKFAYLPAVGVLMVVAWSLGKIKGGDSTIHRLGTQSAVIAVLIVAICFAEGFATHRQYRYWQDTETLCGRMIAVAPTAAMPYFGLGMYYAGQQRFDAALTAYHQAVERDPKYVEALDNLGNLLVHHGRVVEAIPYYQRGVDHSPNDWLAHKNLAIALVKLERHDQAAVHYARVLQLRPGDAEANRGLAISLVRLDRLDEAIQIYQHMLDLRSDDADTLHNLGLALMRKGQLEQARARVEEALRIQPGLAEAHNSLGGILGRLGRPEEALGAFVRCMGLKPDYATAWMNAAAALTELGRIEEAIEHYRQGLQRDPRDADAFCRLGDLLRRVNRMEDANRAYRDALAVNPNHPAARRALEAVSMPGSRPSG